MASMLSMAIPDVYILVVEILRGYGRCTCRGLNL